jgi:uncharacterized protein with HEPN domain
VRNPAECLHDILEAIAAIERHLDGDKTAFEHDELRQAWFLRHLQIIGEAARALPAEVRNLAPEIPWPKIIGMRNVLLHGCSLHTTLRGAHGRVSAEAWPCTLQISLGRRQLHDG